MIFNTPEIRNYTDNVSIIGCKPNVSGMIGCNWFHFTNSFDHEAVLVVVVDILCTHVVYVNINRGKYFFFTNKQEKTSLRGSSTLSSMLHPLEKISTQNHVNMFHSVYRVEHAHIQYMFDKKRLDSNEFNQFIFLKLTGWTGNLLLFWSSRASLVAKKSNWVNIRLTGLKGTEHSTKNGLS